MSMLMGEGINNNGEENETDKDAKKKVNNSDRMQALQNFASQSARVPDAKHSKAR